MTQELRRFVIETMKTNPQHKREIMDLYQLCLDEIEEGGSPQHEMDLCRNEIEELIKD
jgi:hypothetical protein